MAVIYNINRNLTTKEETYRFETVRVLLRQATKPITDQEMADLVVTFSSQLGEAYPRKSGLNPKLLSAASKFLWMRFRSPVVLYDRYAWQWIKEIGKLRDTSSYTEYVRGWRKSFCGYKEDIAAACAEIVPFKHFTLAADMVDDELRQLVQQAWFQERVFDHAIVDTAAKLEEDKGL